MQRSLGGCHGTEGGRWRQPRYDTWVWGTSRAAPDRDRVRDGSRLGVLRPTCSQTPRLEHGLFTTFSWDQKQNGAEQRAPLLPPVLCPGRGRGSAPSGHRRSVFDSLRGSHQLLSQRERPASRRATGGGPESARERGLPPASTQGSPQRTQAITERAGDRGEGPIPEGETGSRAVPTEKSESLAGGPGGPRAVPGSNRARDLGKEGHRCHRREGGL